MDGAIGTRTRTAFLPLAAPAIGQEEIDEVVATLRSDWMTTGPKVKQFEAAFGSFVSAPAALAVNSCTAALHLSLVSLGVGAGDQVITSPLTFCSAAHVIEHVGAQPVFVDVEPDTLNMAPDRVAEFLVRAVEEDDSESRTRAGTPTRRRPRVILPVHLYGHPCDMSTLGEIACEHGLDIVEDAAHALCAKYRGCAIGAGDTVEGLAGRERPRVMTCFSFYATKNLTTGEGGMITGPPELVDLARTWSLHGMSRDAWKRYSAQGSWYYEVTHPGFKYNMADIHAAIGIHQLRRLSLFQARRREIAHRYHAAFAEFDALEIPAERPEVDHAWHVYALRLNTERFRFPGQDSSPLGIRARFIDELRNRKIGTSVHFIPVHVHPYYRDKYGYQPEDFPIAYQAYTRLVSIPLHPRMTDEDVDDVIDAGVDILQRFRR